MTSLEPQEPLYDADDVAGPQLPLGHADVTMDGRGGNVRDFSEAQTNGDARKRDDGSEVDRADRAQIRGGQDCTDRGRPANIDAAKYLESAHCLRFSDLW